LEREMPNLSRFIGRQRERFSSFHANPPKSPKTTKTALKTPKVVVNPPAKRLLTAATHLLSAAKPPLKVAKNLLSIVH
jgi:hypothetical protein